MREREALRIALPANRVDEKRELLPGYSCLKAVHCSPSDERCSVMFERVEAKDDDMTSVLPLTATMDASQAVSLMMGMAGQKD